MCRSPGVKQEFFVQMDDRLWPQKSALSTVAY